MSVHILKMCTYYFVHISQLFFIFEGYTKLEEIKPLKNVKSPRSPGILFSHILTNSGAFVKHIQMMCHAQEPELCFEYFWSYFPLIICDAI